MGGKNLKFVLLSTFLFSLGFFSGLILSIRYRPQNNINTIPLLEYEPIMDKLSFNIVFRNNLKVILLLSFGGVLTFGGLTLLNSIFNGMDLGTLFYEALISNDVKTFFLLILPHGIFEIPGLIIAGSAGFKIPYELLKFALGKKKEMITEEDAKEFFKLVGVSIALILIAAIIESKITLKLAACIR